MSNSVQRERKAFQMDLRRLLPGKTKGSTYNSGTIRNKPEKPKQ